MQTLFSNFNVCPGGFDIAEGILSYGLPILIKLSYFYFPF